MELSYFEDEITDRISDGIVDRWNQTNFVLSDVMLGGGKTLMGVAAAAKVARVVPGNKVNLLIISTVAKREDESFDEAVRMANEFYHVNMQVIQVKGHTVTTFQGLTNAFKNLEVQKTIINEISTAPAIVIMDEAHMAMRDSANKSSKTMQKLIKEVKKRQAIRIVGLTGTAFDNPIIDVSGYQVLAGQYNSKTEWYRKNVVGFADRQGKNSVPMIQVKRSMYDQNTYVIEKGKFIDIQKLMEEINQIYYVQDFPVRFHIPANEFKFIEVDLLPETVKKINEIKLAQEKDFFDDTTTPKLLKINALTTDDNVIETVVQITMQAEVKQPLIFYSYNEQLDALKAGFEENGVQYKELNGKAHSFYEEDTDENTPILVNYKTGAVAFQAKDSNTSIYLSISESSVEYRQSLGRNTRRGQMVDSVMNYIVEPKTVDTFSNDFIKSENRVQNKIVLNNMFRETFKTPWEESD